jgi:hypothetical protein
MNSLFKILKKPTAWIPLAIPLAFFAYLMITIATIGIVREKDEGIGAHLFQLWLVLEPFMVGFFAFKWLPRVRKEALIIIMLQILAALLLLSVVYFLKL